jgi:energy-converting hydrogenase Eha subunit F
MKNKLLLRYFLSSLCGAWMIGISLRFIIDGYLNKQLYQTNGFDACFDWGILLLLGFFVFVLIFFDIRKHYREVGKNGEEH